MSDFQIGAMIESASSLTDSEDEDHLKDLNGIILLVGMIGIRREMVTNLTNQKLEIVMTVMI